MDGTKRMADKLKARAKVLGFNPGTSEYHRYVNGSLSREAARQRAIKASKTSVEKKAENPAQRGGCD